MPLQINVPIKRSFKHAFRCKSLSELHSTLFLLQSTNGCPFGSVQLVVVIKNLIARNFDGSAVLLSCFFFFF